MHNNTLDQMPEAVIHKIINYLDDHNDVNELSQVSNLLYNNVNSHPDHERHQFDFYKRKIDSLVKLIDDTLNTRSVYYEGEELREHINSNTAILHDYLNLKYMNSELTIDNFRINYTKCRKRYNTLIKFLTAFKFTNKYSQLAIPVLSLASSLDCDAIIDDLIYHGANVNECTIYGLTALSYAADKGHIRVVKKLIAAKAPVNFPKSFKRFYAPLNKAIEASHPEIVKILIQHGSNINFINASLKTPLIVATHQDETDDSIEVIKILLEHGADHQQNDEDGNTALDIAISQQKTRFIALLKEAKERNDLQRKYIFQVRHTTIIKANKTVNTKDNKKIIYSDALVVKKNISEMIRVINQVYIEFNGIGLKIKNRLEDYLNANQPENDIWNEQSYPYIKDAILSDYNSAISLLIRHCNKSFNGIARANSPTILDDLIKRGLKINTSYSIYLMAALYNKTATVTYFLNKGFRASLNSLGISPLGEAVNNKNTEMVRALLQAGADPYVKKPDRNYLSFIFFLSCYNSVIDYADSLENSEIYYLLRDAASQPNQKLILNRIYSPARLKVGLICGLAVGLKLGLTHAVTPALAAGYAIITAIAVAAVCALLLFLITRSRYQENNNHSLHCKNTYLHYNKRYNTVQDNYRISNPEFRM